MAGGAKGSGGAKGATKGGGKPRSVGAAAGGGKPNGAILNDNDIELQLKQRFKAWAKGYRDKKLVPNSHEKLYPCPVDWK